MGSKGIPAISGKKTENKYWFINEQTGLIPIILDQNEIIFTSQMYVLLNIMCSKTFVYLKSPHSLFSEVSITSNTNLLH